MIQYILPYLLLFRTINTQLQQCQCFQIPDQFTCEISKRCQWLNKMCDNNPSYISKIENKCDQFLSEECVQQEDCAFKDGSCMDFKGCEIFAIDKCASSINCISDGSTCIQKSECQNYLTQEACKNQDLHQGYCQWNTKQTPNCFKIFECSDLPILKSHIQCENAISQCTIDQKGFCTAKASQCIEYKIFQCFNTIDGKECFWNQMKGKCMEKICLNAQFSTDKQCKQFLSSCTTNGFNCVLRQQCQDITHINGCVIDVDGNECFWTGIICIKKVCQQIPIGNDCYSYFQELDCVPTQSGNCKSRPQNCIQFETEDSCQLDSAQQQCLWTSNQCVLKTCQIAPQYTACALWKDDLSCVGDLNGYCIDLPQYCQSVTDMTYCYKQKSGDICQFYSCTIAYCSKAPKNYNNHTQCEQWNIDCTVELKDSNTGTGCVYKNQNCSDYNNASQCKSTLDRIQCIFLDDKCQDKTCGMGNFTTHQDCQVWKSDCIINEFGTSCQDWPNNCLELISEQQCYIGLQSGVYCEWTGSLCQPQQNNTLCNVASNTSQYDGHEKCNRFNGLCTVIQKVYGCEPRLNCESYFLQHQCVVGIDNQLCFWDGIQCVKKCNGYSNETVDINECQTVDSTCQLNNLIAVCIFKTYCSAYKNKLDCKINNSDQPCKWNSVNEKCEDVVCEDNTTATTERECTYYLNYQQCYLDNVGCISRPQKCDSILNAIVCNETIPRCQTTYCYYGNGCCAQILANLCEWITDATSNYDCQKHNPDCILNIVTGIGCMNSNNCEFIKDQTLCASINGTVKLPTGDKCVSYNGKCYSQNKCNGSHINCNAITVQNVQCKIGTAGTCVEKLCTDFVGTANMANCQSFQSFCYYNGTKCATLLNCNDLTSSGSTVCVSGKVSGGSYCSWNGTSCQTIQCSQISGANSCLLYNNKCIEGTSNCVDITNCNQITNEIYCQLAYNSSNLKCLWLNSSCVDYFDCTNAFTNTYNEYQCIKYDLCRLSKTTVGCEFKSCDEYTQMEYCNKLNQCTWSNSVCQNKSECKFQLNLTSCQSLTYCYWDTTLCKQNVCSTATTQLLCSQVILKSGNKCLWADSVCSEQYQCSGIKNPLTFEDCNNQNNGCVIKYTFSDKNSYCQTKKGSCSQYTSIYQCTKDIYGNLCYWDLSTSTCIYNQCSTYVTLNGVYSNQICQQFNKLCVLNTTLNGCRTILATCNLYTTQQLCDYALITANNYCHWNGASCIDAQCSQYSSLVSPPLSCEQFSKCNLIGGTCQSKLATCNSYLSETLCNATTDLSLNNCAWISNACVSKTCSNYPFNVFNHTSCSQWLTTCTVNYQETQCINIVDCTTAPQEIDTITKCEQFISPTNQVCTISQVQGGCTNIPVTCNLAFRTQCVIDASRNKCYWSKQYGVCKQLTCSNIDSTVTTALGCESLLNQCTLANSGSGCQDKATCNSYNNNTCKFLNIRDNTQRNCVQGCQMTVCEDFFYQSDKYCKAILDGACITNGVQCITSYSCSDFRFDYQCTISRQGFQCLWYNNQCVNRKCELADVQYYHNHPQCQNFMATCTFSTVQNKCVMIDDCSDYDNQESCSLDKYGLTCIWYQGKCYETRCQNSCGDGIVNLDVEQCDDGNLRANDGCYNCQYSCVIGCLICQEGICVECDYEQGYYLDNNDNCTTKCGDEIVQGKEQCDDGNFDKYDGCYNCQYQCHYACNLCSQGLCLECQFGWTISIQGQCEVICGDGIVVATTDIQYEQCDDANIDSFDGCSSGCMIEESWNCVNNVNLPSVCEFTQQPSMVLTLLTIAPNLKQSTQLSFTSNLKYLGVNNKSNYNLIEANILNLNPNLYKIDIVNNNTYSTTTFDPVLYVINVEFFVSVESPSLLVSFKPSEFIDENNQHPVKTKQNIRLFTCYYESALDKTISSTSTIVNSILLYILLAIALISVLTRNLDIFWNLLDMVQYLSYIKYINIQFPTNLNSFFDLFRVITLQPFLDFIHFQTIVNLFSFGETIFIETTNKFKEDSINAFYFYNFGISMMIFCTTFASFYASLLLIHAINKYIHYLYNHKYFLKLTQLYRLLVRFQIYFFYSGIIRIFLTNTYEILFTVLLQLYYPEFHLFITSVSVLIAGMSFCLVLTIIFLMLSKQNQQSNGISDQFTVLSEGVTENHGLWARQFNSLLLIKKLVFMLLLIFMQQSGQLQTTLISITHISFALYLVSKRPMTNCYEYYKMIFVESKITLATSFFILYSMPNLTLDQKYIVGWFHIAIFTFILIFSVVFDLAQQLRVIKDKLIKACTQKQPNKKITIFETIPLEIRKI
ncbi:unnamed protein product (macronuclear) [Paramecium tetraurelia]|uniref:EGF-like domain-containing protein n=1 Tax=Paramecium tetraurelia TaxID=5888 RepID=A0C797_PARTE|nr:uncharacterized protein GSPATT00035794001 [Paramecium tetraurelia]CAK66664.1 unnamed protein product [Paramecium tetraurelia]|eukprot:XP_001434061.1 hypothetical protein (macronuclear) [Paramecium tetraurelia strain d4-2]